MKRGDIVAVAAKGHYSGQLRPALIQQTDLFSALGSVTNFLLTTENVDAPLLRISVDAYPESGLK